MIDYQRLLTQINKHRESQKGAWGQGRSRMMTYENRLELVMKSRVANKIAVLSNSENKG